jgi:hypothetical protein
MRLSIPIRQYNPRVNKFIHDIVATNPPCWKIAANQIFLNIFVKMSKKFWLVAAFLVPPKAAIFQFL